MARYRAYPAYRDSGVPWLGEIPVGWRWASLRWISRIFAGGTPDRNNIEYWADGDIPWLNSGAVNQGLILEPSAYITYEGFTNSSAKWVPKDGLLIALAGQGKTKGMVAQTKIRTTCNQSLAAVIVQTQLPRFIFWWVTSQYRNIRGLASDDGRDGLNLSMLGSIPCPLPSLPEQQAIARFLDYKTAQIDALIAKREALLDRLAEKRTALITQAVTKGLDPSAPMKDSGVPWLGEIPVGWKVLPLKYAVMFQRGHDLPTDSRVEGDVPLVSSSGVSATHDQARARGPGIVTGRYGTIGKFTYVEEDYWPLNTTLYSIHTYNNNVRFLWYMLHNLSALFVLYSQKSAVPGVDRNDLHPVLTALPPRHEQNHIVAYLERATAKVERQQTKIRQAIDTLKEYRTSLITNAVTGKIDVRNVPLPAPEPAEAAYA